MIDFSDVESIIENCFNEMQDAAREKYDAEKADRTAALLLTAQMKLSFLIEEVELKAKHAKNEIIRLEGEQYFSFKESYTGKITEKMIEAAISKSENVVKAKKECAIAESELKKYSYVMSTLKDSHIFFRNTSKNKQWAE